MKYALIVTQDVMLEGRLRTGLPHYGVGVCVVHSLADASRELRTSHPTAVVMDLPWDRGWSQSMGSWLVRNVRMHGIRVVLTARTPLARDLKTAFPVGEAEFLPPTFNLADLAEAVEPGVDVESPVAA